MKNVRLIDERGKWQANGRFWYTRNTQNITAITVHHDAIPRDNRSEKQILQQIYGSHVNGQGWAGTAYHMVLFPETGNLYWINDFSLVTWHDAVNWDSIGILVHGYFHPPINDNITASLLTYLKEVLDELCTNHPEFPAAQGDVFGHRERSSTACPGDSLIGYVQEYRIKEGNVSWTGGVVNPEPEKPDLSKKASFYDKTIIFLAKFFPIKDWFPHDNSDKYTYEDVEKALKYLIEREKHLQPKASERDRVWAYLELKDDDSYDTAQKVIAGFKSRVTEYQNKLTTASATIATQSIEIDNRKEQVGRLELQLTEQRRMYEELVGSSGSMVETMNRMKQTYEGRITLLEGQVDRISKEKGAALIEASDWKAKYEMAKDGNVSQTSIGELLFLIWERIKNVTLK